MVGVLGSNPSVDTKQIPKWLDFNNLGIFLSCFGVMLAFLGSAFLPLQAANLFDGETCNLCYVLNGIAFAFHTAGSGVCASPRL